MESFEDLSNTVFGSTYFYEAKGTNKYNFIELPLYGKIMFSKSKFKFNVFLGPSVGYCLNIKSKNSFTITDDEGINHFEIDTTYTSKDFSDLGFRKFDFSLGLGIGANYELPYGKLYVNTIFHLGLNNLLDEEKFSMFTKSILKNYGLGITFGYLIPLGKK